VLKCSKKYNREHDPYPYFVATPDGVAPDPASERIRRPTAQEVARSNRVRNLVQSVDLAMLVSDLREHLKFKIETLRGQRASDAKMAENPMTDPMRWTLVPPPHPEIAAAWTVLEGLELAIRKDVEAHGAEYWVIMSDDQFQVDPNPEVAEKLRQEMHAANLDYGDERFDSFLTAHGVKHIHLEPAMKAYVQATGAYLHGGVKMPAGEGHWNVLGHRVVAGIVAERLREQSEAYRRWEAAGGPGRAAAGLGS
jgi:hypothetical protein